MCGITGFWNTASDVGSEDMAAIARRMADTMIHRGPDDAGTWTDAQSGLALGFRRLSILDLSAEGHQPMLSADGRYVMVFNGEIYNFRELRAELESLGHRFRGHSDTEVLLVAISQWGCFSAVERCIGMFAFALWDRARRTLYLARDRMGEKPLYYGWMGQVLLFGSELKALRAHPAWQGAVNRDVLPFLLNRGYIPCPHSIYHHVYKLPAGIMLVFRECPTDARPVAYWSLRSAVERGASMPWEGTEQEAEVELRKLLQDAVRRQMVADVPLGAFLSGGTDSSLVVALMQEQSARPVKTFTVGFREAEYDEARYADHVARHLGTEHTQLCVTPEEAVRTVPGLQDIYDEPFADSSQIPTLLVARLARQKVTVSLSGDGGDELFGGYSHHLRGRRLWRAMQGLPAPVRTLLGKGLMTVTDRRWDRAVPGFSATWLLSGLRGNAGHRIYRLAEALLGGGEAELYHALTSYWRRASSAVLGVPPQVAALVEQPAAKAHTDVVRQMMYWDAAGYLADDILVKLDRAAMSVSLESRIPLLDHRVVEFAFSIPPEWNQRDPCGKGLLRQLLSRYVPRALTDRPKHGFCLPVSCWLRGDLREWAESLLDERRLRDDGFFQVDAVRTKWREHLAGEYDWQEPLWHVLMFQAWLDKQKRF
jgi:asparagine synthase (glutamine-hydrolysing)